MRRACVWFNPLSFSSCSVISDIQSLAIMCLHLGHWQILGIWMFKSHEFRWRRDRCLLWMPGKVLSLLLASSLWCCLCAAEPLSYRTAEPFLPKLKIIPRAQAHNAENIQCRKYSVQKPDAWKSYKQPARSTAIVSRGCLWPLSSLVCL